MKTLIKLQPQEQQSITARINKDNEDPEIVSEYALDEFDEFDQETGSVTYFNELGFEIAIKYYHTGIVFTRRLSDDKEI